MKSGIVLHTVQNTVDVESIFSPLYTGTVQNYSVLDRGRWALETTSRFIVVLGRIFDGAYWWFSDIQQELGKSLKTLRDFFATSSWKWVVLCIPNNFKPLKEGIDFLCILIGKNGTDLNAKKMKGLQTWLNPRAVTEVRRFLLGIAVHLRLYSNFYEDGNFFDEFYLKEIQECIIEMICVIRHLKVSSLQLSWRKLSFILIGKFV